MTVDQVADQIQDRALTLLVKPASYLCNLNCTYCFYKKTRQLYPEGSNPKMDLDTARSLVRQALGTNAPQVLFVWQGGEPTLAGLEFFKAVAGFQRQYRRPGQIVENALQTNGILLDGDWCQFLAREHFLVGLSLDGPQKIHDRYRVYHNGKGSFTAVMAALKLLKRHRVCFNILAMVTKSSAGCPEALYDFFRGHRLGHLQFIPCFEGNAGPRSPERYAVTGKSLGRFYTRLFDRWIRKGFPTVSIRYFEDLLSAAVDKVLLSCWAMHRCQGYVVVEHNGDIFPCDFFVEDRWCLGNLLDQGLTDCLSSRKREKFSAMKSNLPRACRRCGMKDMCNGDCTRFRREKDGDEISEYCITLQQVMNHVAPHLPRICKEVEKRRGGGYSTGAGRNHPCPCGSGLKYKKCCGTV